MLILRREINPPAHFCKILPSRHPFPVSRILIKKSNFGRSREKFQAPLPANLEREPQRPQFFFCSCSHLFFEKLRSYFRIPRMLFVPFFYLVLFVCWPKKTIIYQLEKWFARKGIGSFFHRPEFRMERYSITAMTASLIFQSALRFSFFLLLHPQPWHSDRDPFPREKGELLNNSFPRERRNEELAQYVQ